MKANVKKTLLSLHKIKKRELCGEYYYTDFSIPEAYKNQAYGRERIINNYSKLNNKMRKLTLLLIGCIALLSSATAQSQEKGLFLEASIAYGSGYAKEFAIITPTIGYQFNHRWSAGMKVGFETGNQSYTIYTPYIRFSFLDINKLKLFTEAQVNIFSREVDGGQGSYSEAGLSFGLTYPIWKRLNLVGHYLFIGYSEKDDKEKAWLGDKNFALDANIQRLQLGIQYLF